MVAFLLFSAYAGEKQLPTGAPSKIITQPPQATKQIRPLPDLIVERVWLDEKGGINFQLKNTGQGEIPDAEHSMGMVRVSIGNKFEDFSFTSSMKTKPPVDPLGLLKKPGGVVIFNTGIRLEEKISVSVMVDSNAKITEANEKNNQGTLLIPAIGELKEKRIQPVSPEVEREVVQKEKTKTRGGEGRGGEVDLIISDFLICDKNVQANISAISCGSNATYPYNPGGEEDKIPFRVQVTNRGSSELGSALAITIYSVSSSGPSGPSQTGIITQYLTLPSGAKSEYFEIILHQSEQIAQGKLSPGIHEFMAKVRYFDGSSFKTIYSDNQVTLKLTPPHPVTKAIPKRTFTLMSEHALTGVVDRGGRVENWSLYENWIKVSSYGPTRAFISFDLTPVLEEIEKWKRDGFRGYRIEGDIMSSVFLEIEQVSISVDLSEDKPLQLDTTGIRMDCATTNSDKLRRGHEEIGSIYYSLLDYGDSLTSSDFYLTPCLYLDAFQSACTTHKLDIHPFHLYQKLSERIRRIQFRLTLLDENKEVNGNSVTAWFKTPCKLVFTIVASEL